MAVPSYQSLMIPLLRVLGDGREHDVGSVREALTAQLRLTAEDLAEQLPSGRGALLTSRMHWARTHLSRAGLVSVVRRGSYRITPAGLELLKTNPGEVTLEMLARYPGFLKFLGREPDASTDPKPPVPPVPVGTPTEQLEAAYAQLRDDVKERLLQAVMAGSPAFFERLVVELLVRMGYGGAVNDAGKVLGRSGDGGIDGVIKQDPLGLENVYLQAKRWEGNVSRHTVQAFSGALDGRGAHKGVMITTSGLTPEAREFAERSSRRIVLIDGATLADLMFRHGVGVTTKTIYEVKELDSDFFTED